MKATEAEYISEFTIDFVKVVTYQIRRCLSHLSAEELQKENQENDKLKNLFNDVIDVIALVDRALNTGTLWSDNRNVNSVKILAQHAVKLNEISRIFGSYEEDYTHHLSHFMSRCRSAGISVA